MACVGYCSEKQASLPTGSIQSGIRSLIDWVRRTHDLYNFYPDTETHREPGFFNFFFYSYFNDVNLHTEVKI